MTSSISSSRDEYGNEPLLETGQFPDTVVYRATYRPTNEYPMWLTWLNLTIFLMSFFCLLGTVAIWSLAEVPRVPVDRPDIIYSPAYAAEELQTVRFQGTLNATNIYKVEPSPELDSAWHDLYEYDPFLVTAEELQKINKTSIEVPTRPGYYLAKLAVHHQLHCLDYIRRFSRPEYYSIDESMFSVSTIDHVDHCIDMLRQFIQCKADTTLITFDEGGAGNSTQPNFCSTHPCNNFEKIQEWARPRQFNVTEDLPAHPDVVKQLMEDAMKQAQGQSPRSSSVPL